MENKYTPPARKGWEKSKKLKKIITFFTCVVLILTSIFIYSMNYVDGYKYYQTLGNAQILVGQTLDKNFLDNIVIEEQERLEADGYFIVSLGFNPDLQVNQTIVRKSSINEDELKSNILKCFNIETLLTKLIIEGEEDIYYFKTEEECQTFVSELNKIFKVETTIEGTTGSYKLVSNQETLDSLKTKYEQKADAIRKAEEAKRQTRAVTSRGGTVVRSGKKCDVLKSYVYISSEYGSRWGKQHTGVDFAANYGTEIYSWKNGTITIAGWSGGYGNFIEVNHNDGTVSRYAHCSKLAVSVGDKVSAGETIGYVGSTGNSTGNHLHFEIKVNGSFVNPLNYL